MNPQDVFDTVARHLFTQGTRSGEPARMIGGDDFRCLYRDPEGRACAVGALIPEGKYRPSMEGSGATALCTIYEDLLPDWFVANEGLLSRLQQVHDCSHYWKQDHDMKFALASVANAFELDKAVLDSLSFNREPVGA